MLGFYSNLFYQTILTQYTYQRYHNIQIVSTRNLLSGNHLVSDDSVIPTTSKNIQDIQEHNKTFILRKEHISRMKSTHSQIRCQDLNLPILW